MDLTDKIDKEFSQLASLADDRIDLAHGALLIAKAAYPDLDESLYLVRLDRLASDVERELAVDMGAAAIIERINHILFEKEKFNLLYDKVVNYLSNKEIHEITFEPYVYLKAAPYFGDEPTENLYVTNPKTYLYYFYGILLQIPFEFFKFETKSGK